MLPAPTPAHELQRLASLLRHKLLDTPPEPRFEAITRIAAAATGAPVALISLVDAQRQWFLCKVGLDSDETPREVSFCGHAICGAEPLIVPDALADSRFADNPLVTGPPHVRAYLGAPLLAGEGHALGTLCVIDHAPRQWSGRDIALVRDLAFLTGAMIQSRTLEMELSTMFQTCAARLSPQAA
jgi:GAF domain-containing protein